MSRGRMSIVDSGGVRVRIVCTDTEMWIGLKGTVYEWDRLLPVHTCWLSVPTRKERLLLWTTLCVRGCSENVLKAGESLGPCRLLR